MSPLTKPLPLQDEAAVPSSQAGVVKSREWHRLDGPVEEPCPWRMTAMDIPPRNGMVHSSPVLLVGVSSAYFAQNRICFVLEEWLQTLLVRRPTSPLEFSIQYFECKLAAWLHCQGIRESFVDVRRLAGQQQQPPTTTAMMPSTAADQRAEMIDPQGALLRGDVGGDVVPSNQGPLSGSLSLQRTETSTVRRPLSSSVDCPEVMLLEGTRGDAASLPPDLPPQQQDGGGGGVHTSLALVEGVIGTPKMTTGAAAPLLVPPSIVEFQDRRRTAVSAVAGASPAAPTQNPSLLGS